MAEDNLTLQVDEIEALSAIYGDEWCVTNEADRSYCIQIKAGEEGDEMSSNLQVIFPTGYPSESPPIYRLTAPWLGGEEKLQLANSLEEIYLENIGESIIYLWVEQVREFLQKHAAKLKSDPGGAASPVKSKQPVKDDGSCDYGDDNNDNSKMVPTQQIVELSISDEVYECPPIYHGGTLADRKSVFQPHLAPILHASQAKMVLDKLCESKKIASATHNIFAYRVEVQGRSQVNMMQGCEDDGETQAGSRMLHLLQIVDAKNVMVVVTRWYGGVHLGPDRFKHINNCTRSILEEHGYIQQKDDKKGPRSSKKK